MRETERKILAVVGTLAIASGMSFASPPAKAVECPKLAPQVWSESVHEEVARDFSRDVASLNRFPHPSLSGPDVAVHALGSYGAALSTRISMQGGGVQIDGNAFCTTPTLMIIRFGFTDRRADVAREAASDPCVSDAILRHELEHAAADDDALDALALKLEKPLTELVAQIEPRPAPSPVEADAAFLVPVQAALSRALATFMETREQLQRNLETPEELARLAETCDGRARRIASQATGRPL